FSIFLIYYYLAKSMKKIVSIFLVMISLCIFLSSCFIDNKQIYGNWYCEELNMMLHLVDSAGSYALVEVDGKIEKKDACRYCNDSITVVDKVTEIIDGKEYEFEEDYIVLSYDYIQNMSMRMEDTETGEQYTFMRIDANIPQEFLDIVETMK
ncbi:MAG: hypothetical protein ACI39E_07380, partial [Acutalibacteraceae bacterium]